MENSGPGTLRVLKWSTVAWLTAGIAGFSRQYLYTSARFVIIDKSLGEDTIGSGFVGIKSPESPFKRG